MSTIFVDSDNRILLSSLTNQATDAVINDATVTFTIYEYTDRKYLDKAVAVDATGGNTTFPSSGHGLSATDYYLLVGDSDYEAEYQATSATDNSITSAATYVAKTFTGKETISKAVDNARQISMSYITDSTGDYAGIVPDTVKFVLNNEYWVQVTATDTSGNIVVFNQTHTALYHA